MSAEKELTIRLTIDELNVIMDSLSVMPFKDVYSLIGKLNQQVNLQLDKNK